MKTSILIVFLSLSSFVLKTNDVNRLKKESKQMYLEKRYLDAMKIYSVLEKEYKINEPQLIYNHANACYRSLQLKTALKYYKIIAEGNDSVLASYALNQMGIIACKSKLLKDGQYFFKESIRKDPSNTKAVLNLEWALRQPDFPKAHSKTSKEEEKQQKQKKNKDTNNDNEKQTDPNGNGGDGNSLTSEQYRNKYMDINKARLLLESMKNSEKEYIQQHPTNNYSNAKEPAW